jgi:prenyltransferase beta subunit
MAYYVLITVQYVLSCEKYQGGLSTRKQYHYHTTIQHTTTTTTTKQAFSGRTGLGLFTSKK